jgi:hypothetical protein
MEKTTRKTIKNTRYILLLFFSLTFTRVAGALDALVKS